jgi:hypothetical protein
MSKVTYTMFIENGDGAAAVVARGVPLTRALVLALEYGGKGKAAIVHSDMGPLRYFAIGRRPAGGGDFECATYTVVRRSGSPSQNQQRRAPVQVIDGNYARINGVCPWWDAVKAQGRG